MAKETNKEGVESICARVTKPASKRWRILKLIWIDYELFWLHFYIDKQFSLFDTNTNVLTGFTIFLLQYLLQECKKHETK